jgi:hypothetical protein
MTTDSEDRISDAIEDAEAVVDPLDGLTDRIAVDPSAPFAVEALRRLAALRSEDRRAFEELRAQLKRAGVRVTALDEAISEETAEADRRRPTQADFLVELSAAAELFHTPDGTGFADLDINGHRETWPIRAKGFRRWLARRFFKATQGAPSSEALDADGSGKGNAPTVRANPLKAKAGNAADGADANLPSRSVPENAGAQGWRAQ